MKNIEHKNNYTKTFTTNVTTTPRNVMNGYAFHVKMTDELYSKVWYLMQNIDDLNNGNEIGGWVTGDWHLDDESKTATLTLDHIVFPTQEVSRSDVDMEPESMIEVFNELGEDESNRIKAHWHIHPWAGDPSWSSVDEKNMSELMEGCRKIFVFLLSSTTHLKARVDMEIVNKTSFLDSEKIQIEKLDNLPVEKVSTEKEQEIDRELRNIISQKVTEAKRKPVKGYNKSIYPNTSGIFQSYTGTNYTPSQTVNGVPVHDYWSQVYDKENVVEGLYSIWREEDQVNVVIDFDFMDFIGEFQPYTEVKDIINHETDINKPDEFTFVCENPDTAKKVEEELREILNEHAFEYRHEQRLLGDIPFDEVLY